MACETLLTWTENGEVCRFLLTTIDKELRRKADAATVVPLVGVLLACDLPEIEGDSPSRSHAAATPTGIVALLTVADELGQQADRLALKGCARWPA